MTRHNGIALVSTACRFPDADSCADMWRNVLEGRRSFRALPKERLDIGRYASGAVGEADSITPVRAGLLTNWRPDHSVFRIPTKTFEATDLTHWLALELAAEAIAAIGGVDRIDRTRTAVVVANTLAGEFSRTSLLRLRAPFLDEVLAGAASKEGLASEAAMRLRRTFDGELRRRFIDPNEDSLAGGLANTIAGRIANYFDLHGGAYSVDAACASSLVALADAANLLVSEQVDAVMVAAVDLSLDPFELVGFSRNGALATDGMRVFDAKANGFWPGEGGACALLMREKDAIQRELPVVVRIRGWGLSSDGAGGLTRPSLEGQLTAYRRAYEMADIDPADVDFVEAHGTGTAVGDPIEVLALAALRKATRTPLPIGSIKANIGHTKAAAGFAGLIKTVEALRHGVVPPHVSCENLHPIFAEIDHQVRPNITCKLIDRPRGAVAGVSSFGFGGINAHLVVEHAGATAAPIRLPRPPVSQDAELFLFSGNDVDEIIDSITTIECRASMLSMAELSDAAAYATSRAQPGPIRVAIVASDGPELAERMARAKTAVIAGDSLAGADGSVFTGRPSRAPRIGFLFPGQGAPCRPDGGSWRRRFAGVDKLTAKLPTAAGRILFDTEVVQPGIVAASLAAIDVLGRLGISADAAVGHSLGEISALAWANMLDRETALELVLKRGSIMARAGASGGAMLRVVLSPLDAERLAHETGTVVACRNGNAESVLSGDIDAIGAAFARCRSRGVEASELAVSHAFHSPHMKAAANALAETLKTVPFGPVIGATVISTITGAPLAPDTDLRRLLVDQIVQPVLFGAALELLSAESDYLIEIGPGEGLTRLARSNGVAAFSVDAFGSSIKPLLATIGALFAAGSNIRAGALFEDRSIRTFEPGAVPRFLESPCGSRDSSRPIEFPLSVAPTTPEPAPEVLSQETTPLAVVLSALANETGLQISRIGADDRFLDSLHLNSLAVTRVVIAAARALRLRLPSAPTEFSNATPRQLADALTELQAFESDPNRAGQRIARVRPWVRTYAMRWSEGRLPAKRATPVSWFHETIQQPTILAAGPAGDIGLVIRVGNPFGVMAAERLLAEVAQAARANVGHLAVSHDGAPVSAFLRSAAREGYFQSVRAIDQAGADLNDPRVESVLSSDVNGFLEVRLADSGGFEQPVFAPTIPASAPCAAVTSRDVVVVVGGGKGITAECAFEMARRGAAIILVGRSAVSDPTVAATLARAEAKGMRCSYVCANVQNADSLRGGLASMLNEYGPATILLYAPAINQPTLLVDLDAETVRSALAAKTTGLETTLGVLGPGLRRLITFGSIIGRIGLEGETHYALANAMQSAATEAWAAASPDRTALSIEWSVWGGVGMGERLGTIERLEAQGVDAISVDDAIEAFDRLMTEGATGTVAITSRFGPPPDLCLGAAALPMLRFLDEPKVHFPGVELVIETSLNRGRDLYLDDHMVGGVAVMPAVIGLEAMAQTAFGLAPLGSNFTISDITLSRPVSVLDAGATRIRIAALRSEQETTDVQLFAGDDGFAAPCMQASFHYGRKVRTVFPKFSSPDIGFLAQPLYGSLFFNGPRFQRIESFEIATSRQVAARLTPDPGCKWFGSFEPASFVLWDPGATDAVLHALQVAVPHRRVLPVSVERIEIDATAGPLKFVSAIERKTAGPTYTFDLFVGDENGRLAQHWINATFRAVESVSTVDIFLAAPALARSYLERAAREALRDRNIRISLVCDRHNSRESRRDAAIANLGLGGTTERRGDGKLVRANGGGSISIAHREDLTLAVTASVPVGCDIELSNADEGIDFIRRHAALEACRKVGRKLSAASLPEIIPGIPIRIDGMNILITELTLPSGCYTVAVCSREGAARRQPAGNHSSYNEVAL